MPKFSLAILWSNYVFLTVRLRNSHISKVKSVLWSWKPFALSSWMIPRLLSFQRTYNFSGARLGWGIHLDPPLRMRPLIANQPTPNPVSGPHDLKPSMVPSSPISEPTRENFGENHRLEKVVLPWEVGLFCGRGIFFEETVRVAFKVKLMEIDRNRCF